MPAFPSAAVVGTGFIGPVHIEALRRIGVPVRGVVASSDGKARAAARDLGLETAYARYEDVLADPAVGVVHLCSPNRVHHAQVLAALRAGKHVVCEKPLAMSSRETAELVAAAAAHPQQICAVSYNVRFYPLALHVRDMVRRGELGEIFHLQGSYMQDWLLYATDYNWRVEAAEGGALRAIGDVGTHWLDLITFITGLQIEAVMADLKVVHPTRQKPAAGSVRTFTGPGGSDKPGTTPTPISTDDYGAVLLRFTNGTRGVMTVSQVAAGRKNCVRFELAGSQSGVAWNSETPDQLWIGHRGAPNQLLLRDPSLISATAAAYSGYPGGHHEGYPDTFKQFYRAVYADIAAGRRSEQPLYATFTDGHRELQLCEAIAESHRRDAWVRVGG